MCLVDQLSCGSVLTPAISCTKFKIHWAHADSPMAKSFNNLFWEVFLGRTSFWFTDQETQEENMLYGPTPLWVSSYTTVAIPCTKFKIHSDSAHADTIQWQKHFNLLFSDFLGKTSLCFTDHWIRMLHGLFFSKPAMLSHIRPDHKIMFQ